jgi:hypothetical protein
MQYTLKIIENGCSGVLDIANTTFRDLALLSKRRKTQIYLRQWAVSNNIYLMIYCVLSYHILGPQALSNSELTSEIINFFKCSEGSHSQWIRHNVSSSSRKNGGLTVRQSQARTQFQYYAHKNKASKHVGKMQGIHIPLWIVFMVHERRRDVGRCMERWIE